MTDSPQECACPLIDVSTYGGPKSFMRGDPRGSGCWLHETEEMRQEVQRAKDAARYGTHRKD